MGKKPPQGGKNLKPNQSLNFKEKMSASPEQKRPDTALPIPSKETDDADIQGLEEDYGGGKSKLPLTFFCF